MSPAYRRQPARDLVTERRSAAASAAQTYLGDDMRCIEGHETPQGSVFCEQSGSRIVPLCANGHAVSAEARYCPTCGLEIPTPMAASGSLEPTNDVVAPTSGSAMNSGGDGMEPFVVTDEQKEWYGRGYDDGKAARRPSIEGPASRATDEQKEWYGYGYEDGNATAEPRMERNEPNPFGWRYYSPWLFYSMTLIGSFMLLGILGILFTAPEALVGVIPAFFPIILAARQWYLRGESDR
jgi:hypothetical protein